MLAIEIRVLGREVRTLDNNINSIAGVVDLRPAEGYGALTAEGRAWVGMIHRLVEGTAARYGTSICNVMFRLSSLADGYQIVWPFSVLVPSVAGHPLPSFLDTPMGKQANLSCVSHNMRGNTSQD